MQSFFFFVSSIRSPRSSAASEACWALRWPLMVISSNSNYKLILQLQSQLTPTWEGSYTECTCLDSPPQAVDGVSPSLHTAVIHQLYCYMEQQQILSGALEVPRSPLEAWRVAASPSVFDMWQYTVEQWSTFVLVQCFIKGCELFVGVSSTPPIVMTTDDTVSSSAQ